MEKPKQLTREDMNDEEWEMLMDGLCGDCKGFLTVQYTDKTCEWCDAPEKELEEMRKEKS